MDDELERNRRIFVNDAGQEILLLRDFEQYIRSRGLRNEEDRNRPNLGLLEAIRRVQAEEEYQKNLHRTIFGDDTENVDDGVGKTINDGERENVLRDTEGWTVRVEAADGIINEQIALQPLARSCDTVYGVFSSQRYFSRGTASSSNCLNLCLADFQFATVKELVSVLLEEKTVLEISSNAIIECCELAHYLQCRKQFTDIVSIIDASIDSNNCISICYLADRLQIPALFENAMSHITSRLDSIEKDEIWDDLAQDLRMRIVTMRNAVHSSILSRGQKTKVFFNSCEEFLAIFAENIRDQKERLRDAKLRQDEIIRERRNILTEGKFMGGLLMRQRRVRAENDENLMGGSVQDAAMKIEKQERRLKTLETFYEEQKTIFSRGKLGRDPRPGEGFAL